jgi:hypothetical protein
LQCQRRDHGQGQDDRPGDSANHRAQHEQQQGSNADTPAVALAYAADLVPRCRPWSRCRNSSASSVSQSDAV